MSDQCPDEWESEDLHNEDSEYDVYNLETIESKQQIHWHPVARKSSQEIMLEILRRSKGR